jgi:hypothetical protein
VVNFRGVLDGDDVVVNVDVDVAKSRSRLVALGSRASRSLFEQTRRPIGVKVHANSRHPEKNSDFVTDWGVSRHCVRVRLFG